MKKLLFFLLFVVALVGLVYFAGNSLLEGSFQSRLNTLPKELSKYGLNFSRFNLGELKIETPTSISARAIKTLFQVESKPLFDSGQRYILTIREIDLSSKDYEYTDLTLTANDISVKTKLSVFDDSLRSVGSEVVRPSDNMTITTFKTAFLSEPSNPEKGTRELLGRLATMLKTGYTEVDFEIDASTELEIGAAKFPVAVVKESAEQGTYLALEPQAFNNAATKVFGNDITAEELEIIRKIPLRASSLLTLKDHARKEAAAMASKVKNLSESDYRDVFWAFLLRKKIGPSAELLIEANMKGLSEKALAIKKHNFNFANELIKDEANVSKLEATAEKQGGAFPGRSGASYSFK